MNFASRLSDLLSSVTLTSLTVHHSTQDAYMIYDWSGACSSQFVGGNHATLRMFELTVDSMSDLIVNCSSPWSGRELIIVGV